MTSLEVLAHDHPGEAAWRRFARAVTAGLVHAPPEPLADMLGDELARVATAKLGAGVAGWIDRPIGALDRLSPRQVRTGRSDWRTVLQHVLMRMP